MIYFVCPKCGTTYSGGRADMSDIWVWDPCPRHGGPTHPTIPEEVLYPGRGKAGAHFDSLVAKLLDKDKLHNGHGCSRHGAQTSLAWHRRRVEQGKARASTRYKDPRTQEEALEEILSALWEEHRREIQHGKRIVIQVQHKSPIDDGFVVISGRVFYVSGLNKSRAVFAPGSYEHPLTYYPYA